MMNSLVIITRSGIGEYDELTREYTAPGVVTVYDDDVLFGVGAKAGVTLATGPITMSVGDEPTYYANATVYIPATYIPRSTPATPRIDDVVQVMASSDTGLIGRYFRIVDVPVGGRISASINLSCVGIAPSRQWG
jgi:hypothetical protein